MKKRNFTKEQQWLVNQHMDTYLGLCESNIKQGEFIEEVYEIAFGDDAINKGYSHEEVLVRLNEFAHESNHTAKDLATWIQKEVMKASILKSRDGMSDGELLDYIYDACKKITEGGGQQ